MSHPKVGQRRGGKTLGMFRNVFVGAATSAKYALNQLVLAQMLDGTFLSNALKPTEIMGYVFCGRSVRMRSCAQFSFYDQQIHFMTDKFHLMNEPTRMPATLEARGVGACDVTTESDLTHDASHHRPLNL
jgi:hypothetical protein